MNRRTLAVLAVLIAAIIIGAYLLNQGRRNAAPLPEPPVGATLLPGLGNHHHPITTASPEAQRWFDQGVMLTFGFNHDAAERSFLKAAELDPDCAMCWWGASLVLGPHVNAAMNPANNGKAWARLQKAETLAPRATPAEQSYIEALKARYAENPPAERESLDRAYAEAMGQLVASFPDDLDAATLHAEAWMDTQPWDYYDAQGNPKGSTEQVVSELESVMARNPNHAGALHLYVHAVEASRDPDRGAVAADRLRELVPGSGHLVHMPGHIYTRVGRYNDAVIANQKAIAADDAFLATCRPALGVYSLGYVPHNHHFLWWASSMEGASQQALKAADETAQRAWVPQLIRQPEFAALQDYWITPLKAKVQMGRWDEIVATEKPPEDLKYPTAMWHFAQGMAATRQGRLDEAQGHLDALAASADEPMFKQLMIGPNRPMSGTLKVADRVLTGELAAARKDYAAAITALEQGVALEDAMAYFEPPLWHQPVRQTLGAILLSAGEPEAAEAVYREDLARNRDNGWSLYGLGQALRAQNKAAEAKQADERFRTAWEHADVKLTASRF